ncbi:DHH family protein [uncultured archaeon]|nr:DHH family protein [uncultured archaeon]
MARAPKEKTKSRKTESGWVPPASVRAALEKLAGGRVLITSHSLADTDAVASGLALARFLGPQAVFALPDRANSEARRLLGPQMAWMPPFSTARSQFPAAPLILLDCNDPGLLPQLSSKSKILLLIDHHAVSSGSRRARHEWVEPEAASCSELVAALIARPAPDAARFLIWGLLSDSAHLVRAGPRTLRSLAALLERADGSYEEIRSQLRHPPSLQSRAAVLEGLRQVSWNVQREWLVACAEVSSHESHVAEALVGAGADAAFAGTADKKGARISARIRPGLSSSIDLPALMNAGGRFLGGTGGGHPAAAGAGGPRGEKLPQALALARRLLAQNES